MICERCKNKEACYHSTLIVNGNSQSVNLCEDCAKKEGYLSENSSDIFQDFLDDFNDIMPMNLLDNIFCPTCNTSFNEFRQNNYLGCDDCYDTFKNDIKNLMQKYDKAYNDDDKIEFKTPGKTKEDKQIEELQSKLNTAVKEERYEDAADINKQIKALKNKNNKK